MLAVPAATLLHELGHYTVFRAFAFAGVKFHYSSVGFLHGDEFQQYLRSGEFAAATAIAPRWQVALGEAAGPIVSIAILWLAVLHVFRSEHRQPLIVATGLFSSVRFYAALVAGAVLVLRWVLHKGGLPGANVDEVNAALSFGVSPLLAIIAALVLVVAGVLMLVRRLPRNERFAPLGWLSLGTVIGATGYFLFLGPLMLP